MKKKILITMTSMHIGGAERSLIGLLDALDYKKYDIDLFLYSHEGEFFKYINQHVNLLPEIEEYKYFDKPIKSIIFSKYYKLGFARLYSKIKLKYYNCLSKCDDSTWRSLQCTTESLLPFLPKIKGEYDLAIGFIGIHSVLLNKVNAKIKIGWIHTDYEKLYPIKDKDRKIYDRLDYIINVSDECTKNFLKQYPEYEKKVITIENILSKKFIIEQASEDIDDIENNLDCLIFLSIGRFSFAKNFDNIPIIAKKITDSGINIIWYLIGYGGDENVIREKILETRMEKNVIILGKKINPYSYLKLCDYYIQPSRFEGKSVAVREAQILNKPVIITNYSTSQSQLKDGIDGIIVPMDNDECAKAIINIVRNDKLKNKLVMNTMKYDYTNNNEVLKIYKLLGD